MGIKIVTEAMIDTTIEIENEIAPAITIEIEIEIVTDIDAEVALVTGMVGEQTNLTKDETIEETIANIS